MASCPKLTEPEIAQNEHNDDDDTDDKGSHGTSYAAVESTACEKRVSWWDTTSFTLGG